jgi:hypothetical protein
MTAVAVALAVAAGPAGAVQAAMMGERGERVGVFTALAFSGVVAPLEPDDVVRPHRHARQLAARRRA